MQKTYSRRRLIWTSIASAIAGFLILNGSVSHFYKVHFSNDPRIMPCDVRLDEIKREKFLLSRFEETEKIHDLITTLRVNGFAYFGYYFSNLSTHSNKKAHSLVFRSQPYGYCNPLGILNLYPDSVPVVFEDGQKLLYVRPR